jgi:hypothetical protein
MLEAGLLFVFSTCVNQYGNGICYTQRSKKWVQNLFRKVIGRKHLANRNVNVKIILKLIS